MSVLSKMKGIGNFNIYDENKLLIAIGKKKDQLYLLDAKTQPVEIKEMALYTWADWHRCFRHVGISGLK